MPDGTSLAVTGLGLVGPVAVVVTEDEQPDGPVRSTATFPRVSDALAHVVALQADPAFRARVAVHAGEDEASVTLRATRLAGIGHVGQVLLSRAAADLVVDSLAADMSLLDLGVQRLRDLGRPEHVFQMCRAETTASFPPLRSLGQLPNNLPPQLTPFIGRERELEEVQRLLVDSRLVTLTGAGGCGKTRLAAQAVADVVERYPGGVWWVELAGVDTSQVGSAVLAAARVRHDHRRPAADRLAAYVGDRPSLIVLDNCEHVVDAAATLVDQTLRATPAITFLTTSREALSVPGEQVWRVPAMSLPPEVARIGTEPLAMYDAVKLFVDRAARARPGFTVTNQLAPVIAELCVRLDGIALAIELAAARVRMMSPEQILAGLDDRFRLLSGGARTTIARQRTLEASVEWSHALLSDAERILLRRLSVLASGFDLEAAVAVCGGDGLDPGDVVERLGRLVDKSLVAVSDTVAPTRYRLLETIAEFAGDRLLEAGETATVRDLHLGHFLRMAETLARLTEAADIAALDRLDRERSNLEAALEWGLAAGAHAAALRLATMLAPYWLARSHYTVGDAWLTRVLEHAERDAWWARGSAALAMLHLPAMDLPSAFGLIDSQAAAAVAEAVDDTIAAGRALLHQGVVELYLGLPEAAVKVEEAAALCAEGDDVFAQRLAWAVLYFGMTVLRDDAVEASRYADELARLPTPPDGNVDVLVSLGRGHADLRAGRLSDARAHLESAVASSLAIGSVAWQMFAIDGLVELELLTGHAGAVAAILSDGLAGVRGSAPGREEIFNMHEAAAALANGDLANAGAGLVSTEAAVREFGGPWFLMRWLLHAGSVALAQAELAVAGRHLDEALATADGQSSAWCRAHALHLLGRVARREGRSVDAENRQHEALALALDRSLLPIVVLTLFALGGLAIDAESPSEGARLLAAAEGTRAAIGLELDPEHQATIDADNAQVRVELSVDEFQAASAEGRSLDAAEAAAYARRARGERGRPKAGWLSLTPTEEQVVNLVAEGLSNPQIGQRMFISASTVKTHLSHVFAKLGVTTRSELAAGSARREA